KRIVLDVLKPHQPNGLEFTSAIAEQSPGAVVKLTVLEVDEQTETVAIAIEGDDLRYNEITEAITNMGATVHSIDEVEVESGLE
ncbi:MAG: DUF211 domain-containing protein, partial [Gammaproteobacteria bacterium]|nr:DUF211 domain-containing protein [Gammaproteobacteria bacterium]